MPPAAEDRQGISRGELRSTLRAGLEAISLVVAQVHGNRVLTASCAQLEQASAIAYNAEIPSRAGTGLLSGSNMLGRML